MIATWARTRLGLGCLRNQCCSGTGLGYTSGAYEACDPKRTKRTRVLQALCSAMSALAHRLALGVTAAATAVNGAYLALDYAASECAGEPVRPLAAFQAHGTGSVTQVCRQECNLGLWCRAEGTCYRQLLTTTKRILTPRILSRLCQDVVTMSVRSPLTQPIFAVLTARCLFQTLISSW